MIYADASPTAVSFKGFVAIVISSTNFIIVVCVTTAKHAYAQIGILAEETFETKFAVHVSGCQDQAEHLIRRGNIRHVPIIEEIVSLRTIVMQWLVNTHMQKLTRLRVQLGACRPNADQRESAVKAKWAHEVRGRARTQSRCTRSGRMHFPVEFFHGSWYLRKDHRTYWSSCGKRRQNSRMDVS